MFEAGWAWGLFNTITNQICYLFTLEINVVLTIKQSDVWVKLNIEMNTIFQTFFFFISIHYANILRVNWVFTVIILQYYCIPA